MGLPQFVEEVTTPTPQDELIKRAITDYFLITNITTSKIRGCMPIPKGYRVRYAFKVLIAIQGLKRPSKTNLVNYMSAGTTSLIKMVDWLYAEGYIKDVPKPRLIKPFQKYKVDKGYILTDKGKQCLYKIISTVVK